VGPAGLRATGGETLIARRPCTLMPRGRLRRLGSRFAVANRVDRSRPCAARGTRSGRAAFHLSRDDATLQAPRPRAGNIARDGPGGRGGRWACGFVPLRPRVKLEELPCRSPSAGKRLRSPSRPGTAPGAGRWPSKLK